MKLGQLLAITLCCVTLMSTNAFGQSRSRQVVQQQRQLTLGPVVPASNQVSIDQIDHTPWHDLLQKYVDTDGGVNYAALHASAADSAALDNYIASLSTASLTQAASQQNKMAYWINAYNAVTIKGIIQEFPTTSIRNHTSETGGYNLWKNLLLNVGGNQVSLDSMEHKILRPMGDPRIHFAIVCASKGCPRLLNEAYVGETLDAQLTTNTQHFFSIAQNFQYTPRSRSFKMSAIMEWFGTDFGQTQAAQLRAIAPYLPTEAAQAAANANNVNVSFLDYSWELNAQPRR